MINEIKRSFPSLPSRELVSVSASGHPACIPDAKCRDLMDARSCYTGRMLRWGFLLTIALLAALGTAVGLYVVSHDDIGLTRHAIVMTSFGSAAALAIGFVLAAIARRTK